MAGIQLICIGRNNKDDKKRTELINILNKTTNDINRLYKIEDDTNESSPF